MAAASPASSTLPPTRLLVPEEPVSCCGAATASVGVTSGVGVPGALLVGVAPVARAEGVLEGVGVLVAVAGADVPGVAAREGAAERGDVGADGAAAVLLVPLVARGAEVARGTEVVRRGVLVGLGAAVVGRGAAVVGAGAGAETVAGAVPGAEPLPKRRPTEEPGFGFHPLRPTWL